MNAADDEFCERCSNLREICRHPPLAQVPSVRTAARRAPKPVAPVIGDPLPDEPLTELGYAHRLIDVYGDRLRYVPQWRRWLIWDGKRWKLDDEGQAPRLMKLTARSVTVAISTMREDDKERRTALRQVLRCESASGVRGALDLAATEPGIALAPDDLDTDPWLLNCQNGVLDLRTGELGPHDPALHLTKVTGAAHDPNAPGVEFSAFLARVQPDPGMRAFLARLFGHALPGTVIEHLLPILYGTGANGKSTLLEHAICPALGDYAASADPALFTERRSDAHPTGVADLFGRRLAVVQESDSGRHLAEGTVKRLTGGDRIKARRMHENFWEFKPSHTVVMLTNHRPLVRGTDEGIWRRLRMVPFDVVIPPEERDGELGERLRLELDAVLAWIVAGYNDWREHGLAEPAQVTTATDEYRTDSDALGRFFDQRCLLGPHYHVSSADLFDAWQRWCAAENLEPGTQTAFARVLHDKGLENEKDRHGRKRWRGIGLESEDDE